jgi:DNA-binding HxlR family transcriptional regulator
VQLDRFDYSAENCSIARTLEVVGEKWSLLIMREAFYGVRRFRDFHRALGCPRDVLSARLKRLVGAGVLRQVPYQEPGDRPRSEYQLTDKGLDLQPALLALMGWGDRWAADDEGPAVVIKHRDCGGVVSVELSCAEGHDHLTARDLQAIPGPGARSSAGASR